MAHHRHQAISTPTSVVFQGSECEFLTEPLDSIFVSNLCLHSRCRGTLEEMSHRLSRAFSGAAGLCGQPDAPPIGDEIAHGGPLGVKYTIRPKVGNIPYAASFINPADPILALWFMDRRLGLIDCPRARPHRPACRCRCPWCRLPIPPPATTQVATRFVRKRKGRCQWQWPFALSPGLFSKSITTRRPLSSRLSFMSR